MPRSHYSLLESQAITEWACLLLVVVVRYRHWDSHLGRMSWLAFDTTRKTFWSPDCLFLDMFEKPSHESL